MDREDQLNQIWTFPIEELQKKSWDILLGKKTQEDKEMEDYWKAQEKIRCKIFDEEW